MAKLRTLTDKGIPKGFRPHEYYYNKADNYLKEIEGLLSNYWGNAQRPRFYRTREELESLAGLGVYNKITHRYENGDSSIIGIEISFEHIEDPTLAYLKLRPFTIWDATGVAETEFPEMRKGVARVVVTKETVAALARHIDPMLAWNFNQHRAFLLEITVGKDKNGYVAILRHIHHFIPDFKCAESHNPVRIPPDE